MRSNRFILAAALVMGALLSTPLDLEARPDAVQQSRKAQRNAVLQQQAKNLRLQHKKKVVHGISGTVVSIHHNKEAKGTGTITLAVHHAHRKHVGQNAANINAKAAANKVRGVNRPIKRGAVAIGQRPKKKANTVTIKFARGTKFAVTVRDLVQGKPQVKTVGSGKSKTKVLVAGKIKLETRNLPTNHTVVQKGQHLKITLHDLQHNNAREVHIIHPSAEPKRSVKN